MHKAPNYFRSRQWGRSGGRRRWMVAALLSVVVAVSAACSQSSGDSETSERELVTLQVSDPLQTMDPAMASGAVLGGVQMSVFQTLTTASAVADGSMAVRPLLATSWEMAEDGKSWTYQLREDVTFTDGTPFDADVVVKNFERVFDPDLPVPLRSTMYPYKAEALGKYEVRISTPMVDVGQPGELTGWYFAMVSPKSIDEWGADLGLNKASGTGPYEIASYEPQKELNLLRNDSYWGDDPGGAENLKFISNPDANSSFASLQSGQSDGNLNLTVDQVRSLESGSSVEVETVVSNRLYQIHLPMNLEPMKDVRVRQALNHAVDKKAIVDHVFNGYAESATSSVPSWPEYEELGLYEYDTDKASQLLEEAGWTPGTDGILQKDGEPFPTVTFAASNGHYPQDAALAEALTGYFEAIGLPVDLKLMPFATFFESATADAAKQNWMTLMPWGLVANDPYWYLLWTYTTGQIDGGHNWGGYSNKEYDKLVDSIAEQTSPEERTALINEGAQVIWDEAPSIFVARPNLIVGVQEGISGLYLDPGSQHSYWTVH